MSHSTGDLIESPREPCGGLLDATTPTAVVERGVAVANLLADIIRQQKLFAVIRGKRHVLTEGWCVLGAMGGILPREVSVVEDDAGNVFATVELVRVADLGVVGRASAMVGVDEPEWQKRPRLMRRSMAVTRATGKAFRLLLAWVIRLAGYDACPADEIADDPQPVTSQSASVSAANVTATANNSTIITAITTPTPTKAVESAPATTGVVIDMSDEGVHEAMTAGPSTPEQHERIRALVKRFNVSKDRAIAIVKARGADRLADLSLAAADAVIRDLGNVEFEEQTPF